MKITIFLLLFFLCFTPGWAMKIPEALKDAKPVSLSIVDQVLLNPVVVRMGASKMRVLVNRVTGKVEYVWSNVYRCYVRPQYAVANAQILYNQFHN